MTFKMHLNSQGNTRLTYNFVGSESTLQQKNNLWRLLSIESGDALQTGNNGGILIRKLLFLSESKYR